MSAYEEKSTSVGERRRASRRDADVHLEVQIDSESIHGQAENISAAGVFFFSRDPLKVTVKLHDGVTSQSYSGKLVRVERLSQETTGFAIEFDRL